MQSASLKMQSVDAKSQAVNLHHLNLQANLARRVIRDTTTVRPEPMRLAKRVAEHG